MHVPLPAPGPDNVVTQGEIVTGIAWFIVYGLMIFGGLSGRAVQLIAAIGFPGL